MSFATMQSLRWINAQIRLLLSRLNCPYPLLTYRADQKGSLFHLSEVLAFGLVFWSVINNDDIPIHFVRDSCGGADMF
jgi:hypothetical protein